MPPWDSKTGAGAILMSLPNPVFSNSAVTSMRLNCPAPDIHPPSPPHSKTRLLLSRLQRHQFWIWGPKRSPLSLQPPSSLAVTLLRLQLSLWKARAYAAALWPVWATTACPDVWKVNIIKQNRNAQPSVLMNKPAREQHTDPVSLVS